MKCTKVNNKQILTLEKFRLLPSRLSPPGPPLAMADHVDLTAAAHRTAATGVGVWDQN